MVDAGIKLPGMGGGHMSSAASMPNLTAIGKLKEPLVRSNSIPDNHQIIDGELSKYLISNQEMMEYEAEYHKAAAELQVDMFPPPPSKSRSRSQSPKLDSSDARESRVKPPSFTSALTAPANNTVPNVDIKNISSQSYLKSSFDKQATVDIKQEAVEEQAPANTKQNRVSPQREERGNQKWNDGSIERMAEKWAAKRDTLLKGTNAMTDNLQQRKLAMEQKLESVKRSIPKRTIGFTPESVQKRLSLCEMSPPLPRARSEDDPGKRNSLDVDLVLPPPPSEEDLHEDSLSKKMVQIRARVSSPSPVRKSSPELGSSDSDDSLPPYPVEEFTRLDLDKPLPPPPVSLTLPPPLSSDTFSDVFPDQSLPPPPAFPSPPLLTSTPLKKSGNLSFTKASALLAPPGSTLASYKKVTAPHTSVAVSRSITAPQKRIADQVIMKPISIKETTSDSSSTAKLKLHSDALLKSEDTVDKLNASQTFVSKQIQSSLEGKTSKLSQLSLKSGLKKGTEVKTSLQHSKLAYSAGQRLSSKPKAAEPPVPPHNSDQNKLDSTENKSKTVVYINGSSSSKSRELKPPQTLQTAPQTAVKGQLGLAKAQDSPSIKLSRFGTKPEVKLDQNEQDNLPDNRRSGVVLKHNSEGTNGGSQGSVVYDSGPKETSQINNGSRSSSPPSQESMLTPDSLESFSPSGTPQSPGSSGWSGKTGLVGPRRSSGMRMWQGQMGARRNSRSPTSSRSPSPSNHVSPVSRKTETLPRATNLSKSRLTSSQQPQQIQRRSYGGTIAPPAPSTINKYSSAPNTPRHSRNDLRQVGSSPNSPGGSRSTSPAPNKSPDTRRRSAHYPVSTQYEMKAPAPARTVSERSLLGASKPFISKLSQQPQARAQSQSSIMQKSRTSTQSMLQPRTMAVSASSFSPLKPSSSGKSTSSTQLSRVSTSQLSTSSPRVQARPIPQQRSLQVAIYLAMYYDKYYNVICNSFINSTFFASK